MIKIRKDFDLKKLLDYGFKEIDKEEEERNENYDLIYYDFAFDIGHTRRGQHYYLLVDKGTRIFTVTATDPDGSGAPIGLPSIILDMQHDEVFEYCS